MPPRLTKAEVRRGGLPSGGMFQEVLLAQISIAETKDKGELLAHSQVQEIVAI